MFSGAPTVNRKFGTKVAVLVGDFLFAQSSWFLAKLDNLEVRLVQSYIHALLELRSTRIVSHDVAHACTPS